MSSFPLGGAAGSPTSRMGYALPEDMFAASPTSSGPTPGVRVHAQGFPQPGGYSSSPQRGPQNGMDAFGAFGGASPSTEVRPDGRRNVFPDSGQAVKGRISAFSR